MKQVVQEHSYVLRPEERRTRWDQLLAEHARLNSPTRSKSSSSHGGSRKTRGELSGGRTTTPGHLPDQATTTSQVFEHCSIG